MTVERYLSTVIRKWRNSMFKPKTALIVGFSIGFGLLVLNIGVSVIINFQENGNNANETDSFYCVNANNYTTWMWVSCHYFKKGNMKYF